MQIGKITNTASVEIWTNILYPRLSWQFFSSAKSKHMSSSLSHGTAQMSRPVNLKFTTRNRESRREKHAKNSLPVLARKCCFLHFVWRPPHIPWAPFAHSWILINPSTATLDVTVTDGVDMGALGRFPPVWGGVELAVKEMGLLAILVGLPTEVWEILAQDGAVLVNALHGMVAWAPTWIFHPQKDPSHVEDWSACLLTWE